MSKKSLLKWYPIPARLSFDMARFSWQVHVRSRALAHAPFGLFHFRWKVEMRKWLVNITSVYFFSSPGLLEHDFVKKTAREKRWSARVSRLKCTRSPRPVDRGRPQCPVSYPDNNSASRLLCKWSIRSERSISTIQDVYGQQLHTPSAHVLITR